MSDDLLVLIQQWQYVLTGFETPEGVSIGRGVRQGCKIALFLWCALMTDFLLRASDHIGSTFVKQFCTLHADDLHLCSLFYSEVELKAALHSFGQIIHLLRDLDLELSPSKSKAMWTIVGCHKRRIQAKHTIKQGDKLCLVIPLPDATHVHVPLVNSTIYLGVSISYGRFEQDTMQLRLRAARNGFHKLKPWLVGRRHLSTRGRPRLWRQCIWPMATYGLASTGITSTSMKTFMQAIATQIREVGNL